MKTLKLTKVIASLLIVASVLVLAPIGASAESMYEKPQTITATAPKGLADGFNVIAGNKVLSYKNGNLYTGAILDVFYDVSGYAENGVLVVNEWRQIDSKWYYFGACGEPVKDGYVEGYKLNSDGIWTGTLDISKGTDIKKKIILDSNKPNDFGFENVPNDEILPLIRDGKILPTVHAGNTLVSWYYNPTLNK